MPFFGNTRDSRGRDNLLKQALTNNLSECVKAIQFNQQTEDSQQQTVGSSDLSNALCMALEAILLHGLKDTFFRKARSAFTGDIDHRPQPDFWPLLLILSHRANIKQISSLQQITSDIGQCRAWIRIALNDSLMSSYFSTIMKDMSTSKPYYSHSAYIRDVELLDVAQRLLEGIESCTQFDLPVNSSLLNTWPEDVLMLAGIWTPTMRSCPVAPGVDVASTLTAFEPEERKKSFIPGRDPNTAGLGQMLAIDPDEAVNFILSNTPDGFMDDIHKYKPETLNASDASDNPKDFEKNADNNAPENSDDPNMPVNSEDNEIIVDFDDPSIKPDFSVLGNSIIGKTAWSSDLNEDIKVSSNNSSNSSVHESKSVSSLVEIGTNSTGPFVKTPNLREVVKGLHKELNQCIDDQKNNQLDIPATTPTSPDEPLLSELGFEVISKSPSVHFDSQELQKMISQLGTLSREYGLDSQDYQCRSCNETLGTTISKAKVCAYTGQYFCSSCMDPNVFMVPARVVHNWDFYRYPVSKRAALFLLEFQHQPLINMKKLNPLIYTGVAEMAQLQMLRIQLNFLRAYLFTCREPVIEELQKRVWPREYLYEHVHIYSVSDLAQISNGSLASQLQTIVNFAQNHVKDCWLCSQKGFICEVCNNPKILYPFNIETTYRCHVCSSVFHAKCLNPSKPCPKCERKKKRQGKSLIDAVHSNF